MDGCGSLLTGPHLCLPPPHPPPPRPSSLPHCPRVTFLRKISGHILLSLHQKKKKKPSQLPSGKKCPNFLARHTRLSIIQAQAFSLKPSPASLQSTPDIPVTLNLMRSQSISCVWMLTCAPLSSCNDHSFPLSWGALSHLDDSAQS